jgi:hypothetical protein
VRSPTSRYPTRSAIIVVPIVVITAVVIVVVILRVAAAIAQNVDESSTTIGETDAVDLDDVPEDSAPSINKVIVVSTGDASTTASIPDLPTASESTNSATVAPAALPATGQSGSALAVGAVAVATGTLARVANGSRR